MKRIILSLLAVSLLAVSCQDEQVKEIHQQQEISVDMTDFYVYTDEDHSKAHGQDGHVCGSMKVLNRQLKENPGLENRMYNIEKNTRKAIAAKAKTDVNAKKPTTGGGDDPVPYTGSITIPVIVNILEDANHPVTAAHINSQIDILNEDYNNNNPNSNNVPSEFAGVVANTDITFVLAGVNRKASTRTEWGTNDAMKYASQGGIDATNPDVNLNFWICEIGGGILGYAQFPGGSLATDGVVIGSDFFGENAAGGQYGHGRTATHEVGHWLNLRHIWGDGRCRQDDFVADTPSSDSPNYGCPTYPTVKCRSNDMTMNYMDYVDDNCMYMFTEGQNDRMRALFTVGGEREGFVN